MHNEHIHYLMLMLKASENAFTQTLKTLMSTRHGQEKSIVQQQEILHYRTRALEVRDLLHKYQD